MPRLLLSAFIALSLAAPTWAIEPAPVHTGTPHRILVGDYSKKLVAIVGVDGKIEWQQPIGAIHDAWLLPSGNVLFQTSWQNLVEMTPEGKEAWKYHAGKSNGNEGKPVEVHAFQRLADGVTMIAESGPCRIIEVAAEGNLLKEVKLKVEHPSAHLDTRLARKLTSGNYLVAHEGENKKVREYDPQGTVVWEYDVKHRVYSAERLANGNTLIGTGDGHKVIEVDREGKTLWSLEQKDVEFKLAWITMVERLANGNTVVVNCHAGEKNPQMFEVTADKKVVWTFNDRGRFGDALAVGRVLDAKTPKRQKLD
jgi:outer membrane protein assembly factor BamB